VRRRRANSGQRACLCFTITSHSAIALVLRECNERHQVEFRYFEIESFRGINKVRLNLTSSPKSKVVALVGLNESGKTTVLEAINHFSYKTETLAPLELAGYAIKDPHTLIPIAKRANFNGVVSVKVGLALDDSDWAKLRSQVLKELGFKLTRKVREFEIHQKIVFKNSKHDTAASVNHWGITLHGETKDGKKKYLDGEEWQQAVAHLKPVMPSILFFPNFLFEFPDRIYLEDSGQEDEKHAFYRLVLQDGRSFTPAPSSCEPEFVPVAEVAGFFQSV